MAGENRKFPSPGRRRNDDRLASLMDCFLGFGADPVENINRLAATCGQLLGATCALYNRMERGMLCSLGQWNTPPDFNPLDKPDGHICYDVIQQASDEVLVVRNLQETPYVRTDPNVLPYRLQTYIGKAVIFGGKSVGSLCAVFQRDYVPDEDDKKLLGTIAKAISVEEERQRATEALRESNETLEALFRSSPLAIVTFDSRGIIRIWNPAAERMFGWSADEVIGKPHPIVPEDKQEEFRVLREVALRGEIFTNREVRRRRKDGTQIDLSISTAPLRDAGGGITSIMSIITDVTGVRSLEERFQQAQKMEAVGRLAGGIAHDFNNLLTTVTGYSELLLERIGDQDPMWREIEEIRRAGVRAASLTRKLLAFSRKQVLQMKVLDLCDIINDIETMVRRLIGEDVELAIELGEAPARLKADQGQIEQVIMNLVINARESMPQGGRLIIRTAIATLDRWESVQLGLADPGAYAMLAVSDTGTGMNEEVKSHLFEPFFTTKQEGTGLGLATVYGIVQQSGGGIRVDSEVGKGTTFEIFFPRVEGFAKALEPAVADPVVCGGLETVLVVEDENMVRELVCEILQRNGYIVLEASHGEEALRVSARHHGPIHLLLTDLVMPRMRGTDLAGRLAPLRPEMKILYMSGYTDDAAFHSGNAGKGAAFIQKPFGPGVLSGKVREILDARGKEVPR